MSSNTPNSSNPNASNQFAFFCYDSTSPPPYRPQMDPSQNQAFVGGVLKFQMPEQFQFQSPPPRITSQPPFTPSTEILSNSEHKKQPQQKGGSPIRQDGHKKKKSS
ncbi:unnamed protein product [Lactuca virosa]|uniref:DET1- and DDB1-associated protein 1 n=1 Tax=Lactuca virosa TaxID=75947 RepID=A0AAU9LWQ9_9ASTR|nr:unnamed protein product [Lactuca virosa]